MYQKKNIVKTEIQGRNGTIKEITGASDHEVTINGILTAENGSSPLSEAATLKKMLDASKENQPVEVISSFLNLLEIFNLAIESYDFPQDPGGYSVQTFTISALSDAPIQLQTS